MSLPILVLCPDLIFATKIFSTAKAVGATPIGARTIEAVKEKLTSAQFRLFVIDLNAHTADPIEVIRAAKSIPNSPPILAFLSHVQVDLAAAAKEAGAETVLPRSAFSAKLESLLA